VVEDDTVFEESEFQIGEPVTFVSQSWNSFKGTYEVVGRVSDKASGVSFTGASFLYWAVVTR
jgi:hypothetical protein